jgi:hypothetical protein
MWLEGRRHVSIFILVKFEETPKYQCPVRDLEDFEQLGFPKATELRTSNFSLVGNFGPAIYKRLAWVGQIAVAFIEIWKRDPITGFATRNGNPIVGHY